MQIKFEGSNSLVKNIVEIDSLGEDMEEVSLKDSRCKRTSQEMMQMVKSKKLK